MATLTQQPAQELDSSSVPDLVSKPVAVESSDNGDGASVLVTPHRDYLMPSTSQHLPIQETHRPRHGSEELVL